MKDGDEFIEKYSLAEPKETFTRSWGQRMTNKDALSMALLILKQFSEERDNSGDAQEDEGFSDQEYNDMMSRLEEMKNELATTKYVVGERFITIQDEIDYDDNTERERVTPAGSVAEIFYVPQKTTEQYAVQCHATNGWWFYSEKELDQLTKVQGEL